MSCLPNRFRSTPSTPGGVFFCAFAFLLYACILSGCRVSGGVHVDEEAGLDQLLDTTRAFIQPQQLQQVIDEPNLVLLHVGHGQRGYQRGHIPGARYVDFKEIMQLERDGLKSELPSPEDFEKRIAGWGVTPASTVVLYGDAAGVFPARLYVTMKHYGCGDRVRLLNGHLRGWAGQGRKLATGGMLGVKGSGVNGTVEIKAEGVPSVVVSTGDVEDALEKRDATILDVRPEDQYAGVKKGSGVIMAGRVPGAVNMPWQRMVTGVKPPWLADKGQLRSDLVAVGVTPDRPVIVYDAQGMHSSLAFAVLEELGYSVSLYDGGYAAWSKSR
ncbi:MAG: rhodanese-like domain-containing protein [Planctomycetota bacterium]